MLNENLKAKNTIFFLVCIRINPFVKFAFSFPSLFQASIMCNEVIFILSNVKRDKYHTN